MIYALMFALARMASAAWVGAALLFVVVAIDQTKFYSHGEPGADPSQQSSPEQNPPADLPTDRTIRRQIVARLAVERFPHYYIAGSSLIGISFLSSLFLRRRYLKDSRWALVMAFLAAAGGLMAYDYFNVFEPLKGMMDVTLLDPAKERPSEFETLHQHSEMINAAQLLLMLMASFLLCMPGTRPEQPTILMSSNRASDG